jgi:flagellar hook-basal body complex protein FliE
MGLWPVPIAVVAGRIAVMEIRPISSPTLTPAGGAPTAASGIASFEEFLTDALGALQRTRSEADALSGALAAGQDVDLHEVILAMEQASLATQLTLQVRNKLIEAYQEISRMQI